MLLTRLQPPLESVMDSLDTASITMVLRVLSTLILLRISSQLDGVKRMLLASLMDGVSTANEQRPAALITDAERRAYQKKADQMVGSMLDYTSPTGSVQWSPIGTVDGAAAFQASMPGSDVVCVKGVVSVDVAEIDDVKRGFTDNNTDAELHRMMAEVDKQFFEQGQRG